MGLPFIDPRSLGLTLSTPQVDALFFLLGSFVVASLSDLRHLSAQREFAEVWAVISGLLLILDVWNHQFNLDLDFGIKWGLVIALAILSFEKVGLLFRLAPADVLAIAAAASLLSASLVIVFAVVLKLVSWPAERVLAKKGSAYPFLPVVTLATIAVLALGSAFAG
ncbi:MAG: hypothetical protein ACYDDF_07385 [Thermoplasmatota archaeon]